MSESKSLSELQFGAAREGDGAGDAHGGAWLDGVYQQVAVGRTHAAMDALLLFLDERFDAGDFSAVDAVLPTIDLDKLNVTLWLGLLGFTKVAADRLSERRALLDRIEAKVRLAEPQRCERLLARVR